MKTNGSVRFQIPLGGPRGDHRRAFLSPGKNVVMHQGKPGFFIHLHGGDQTGSLLCACDNAPGNFYLFTAKHLNSTLAHTLKLAASNLDIRAFLHVQAGLGGDFLGLGVLHHITCELNVPGSQEMDRIGGVSFVFRVVVEAVGPHDNMFGILDSKGGVKAAVDAVAREDDPAGGAQVDGGFLAADQIARDRQQSDRVGMILRPQEPEIGASGAFLGLNGVPGDAPFANCAVGAIEKDVGAVLGIQGVVVFDVVANDLYISDLAILDDDAALLAIADMVAGDVDLVKVDFVEKNADAGQVVNVAVGNDDIAIAQLQVNAMSAPSNQYPPESWLHDSFQAKGIRLGMAPVDFHGFKHGHALVHPGVLGEIPRLRALLMRTNDMKGRAGPLHDHCPRSPFGSDGAWAGFGQNDSD